MNRRNSSSPDRQSSIPRLQILLVEDNEMNRDMLSRRLYKSGYDTITANNGNEAMDILQTSRPDLILMDLSLPEMDGWQLTRKIKADNELKSIPLIVLTAHALDADRESAYDAGCDDFDVKPINFQRLLKKIELNILRRKGN